MEQHEGTTRNVAGVVKGLLESGGISLRAASEATGIPATTLHRRITGHTPFSVVELAAIASMFNTTVSRLVFEAEQPQRVGSP